MGPACPCAPRAGLPGRAAPGPPRRAKSARPACRRPARPRSRPSRESGRGCRSLALRLAPLDLAQALRHAVRRLQPAVVVERQLGRVAHLDASAQLAAHEAGCLAQPLRCLALLRFVAQHAHVDAGAAQVRRQRHARDRHEADTRVLELRNDAGALLADLLRQPLRAARHRISVCASSSWMSRAEPASPATLCSVLSRWTWSVFTLTTASRARCQRSWCSTSASATL